MFKIIMKTQLREAPNFMAPILPQTPPTQGPWFLTSFRQKTSENTAIQLLQWLRDAISFPFRVNQLHTPLCQNAAFPPELRSVTLSAIQELFPQYRNSSRSKEFFPQCRSSSHSAETHPAVQKVLPQYIISSCSAEILPTVHKSFPQYIFSRSTELFPQYINSSHSTEIHPAVQEFVPQYRNSSRSADMGQHATGQHTQGQHKNTLPHLCWCYFSPQVVVGSLQVVAGSPYRSGFPFNRVLSHTRIHNSYNIHISKQPKVLIKHMRSEQYPFK